MALAGKKREIASVREFDGTFRSRVMVSEAILSAGTFFAGHSGCQ